MKVTYFKLKASKKAHPLRRLAFSSLLCFSWSLHCSAMDHKDSDDDAFDERPRQSSRQGQSPRAAPLQSQESLLRSFHRDYTVQSVNKSSAGDDSITVVVVHDTTRQTERFTGSLINDASGPIKSFHIKHRNGDAYAKPVVGRDNNLEPLIGWYRETVFYPKFTIQINYKDATIQLSDVDVTPLSNQTSPTQYVKVHYKEGHSELTYHSLQNSPSQLSLDVFVELRCPDQKFYSVGLFPYERLDENSTDLGYVFPQDVRRQIERLMWKDSLFMHKRIPGLPGFGKDDILLPFMLKYKVLEPVTGIKARTVTPAHPTGEYEPARIDSLESPYLCVETNQGSSQFFLTRTQNITFRKKADEENTVVLKLTQKIGLIVDAVVDRSPRGASQDPLVTGLFEKVSGGRWFPISEDYTLSKARHPYYFKFTKVTTVEPYQPDQLLSDLSAAQGLFYSQFMTLELPHPFLSGISVRPLTHQLSDKFYKIVGNSYPPFPLPNKLRVLRINNENQPPIQLEDHYRKLSLLPLNRLVISNVYLENTTTFEMALRIRSGAYSGKYSQQLNFIDLSSGHSLETLEDEPDTSLVKRSLQKQRDAELETEFRNFCR